MNLIEGWGTGIPRLFREMKEYGLAEPEFIDMEIALRINLYRVGIDVKTDAETDEETSEETDGETDGETSGEKNIKNKVLVELRRNPVITQRQLAKKIGLSYSGIRYVMRQLQDEGILKRVGSTKKGQWIIQERE